MPVSRIDRMRATGAAPTMPPNPAPHLIDRLIEIGLTEAAGMGAVPLSWREIAAWCAMTGVAMAPWEARLIRRLSVDYLAESRRAEADTCPPPWRIRLSAAARAAEAEALKRVLG